MSYGACASWPDRTAATQAENGVRHHLRTLPAEERAALRAAFAAELDRLYAAVKGMPHEV